MTDRPLASIVITTHNRPELVRHAIASALAQTVADLEVLVVDDGSEPAFAAEPTDHRVHVIRRERAGGPSAARNTGIAEARGAWITFLDDDDELMPDMVRRSVTTAEQSTLAPPVAVMSAVTVRDMQGNDLETLVPVTLERGEHYFLERRGDYGRASNSLMVPTDVMRAIGGFDDELDVFQHDDLGLRLNAVATIVGVDEPLYRMIDHGEPRVSGRGAAIPNDMERTLAKHPEAFAHHRDGHARYMSSLAFYHLKTGNWGLAVRWSMRALARDPRQPRVWAYAAAAAAGPHALDAARRTTALESWRARRARGPASSPVSWWTLTRGRIRKYGRRLLAYPRALMAWPVARLAWALARFRRPELGTDPSGPVLLLSVYRERNAGILEPAVTEALDRGWDIRLWALDRPHPALAEQTVGAGPGARFPWLNALVGDTDLDGFEWVIVVDDDVRLPHRSLGVLLSVAEQAGLDLVQPAHSARSHHTFDINVRRPLAIARQTSFVESGPAFAVRRPWITRALPFAPDHEMGWGVELEWHDLVGEGARLGIVDAVAARHLVPIGGGYPKDRETDILEGRLRDRGLAAFRDVHRSLGMWHPWQASPPWASRMPAAASVHSPRRAGRES
ncbi:MAG: glycosyltransferase family 2 protein [Acidimicrobiia bacterium]